VLSESEQRRFDQIAAELRQDDDLARLENPEAEDQVASSWRRFQQALDTMNDAEESEDFQAAGVKCRDALLALAKDHAAADWLGEVQEPPKTADFKGWGNIFAERLSEGRLRNYLKWGLHLAAVMFEFAQVSWSRQGRPACWRSRLRGSIRSRTGGGGGGRVRPALRSSL